MLWVAYAPLKMSNKRHIEKNDWIITATDPTFASENHRRKTWRGPKLSVHPLSLLSQLLGKHGVNPAPSITPFQRRADKAGTRPPGQGGGSSHALPASWSPTPLQTELQQLVWPLGVGQDRRAPAQQQQLPAQCPQLLHQHSSIKSVLEQQFIVIPLHSLTKMLRNYKKWRNDHISIYSNLHIGKQ